MYVDVSELQGRKNDVLHAYFVQMMHRIFTPCVCSRPDVP
jgi:hypothetical protein